MARTVETEVVEIQETVRQLSPEARSSTSRQREPGPGKESPE